MNTEILSSLSEQGKTLLAPVQRLNKVAVTNCEKLAALQLASLREYSTLGINQLKAALEVNDPKSLQAYIAAQSEIVKTMGDKLAADAKTVTQLGVEFNAEVKKVIEEGVSAARRKLA